MEELMELLDDKMFTPEIKEKLADAFKQAVETEVEIQIATQKAEEENEENEDGEEEGEEEIYDGEASVLNDMSKEDIVAKSEEYTQNQISKLEEQFEEYTKHIKEEAEKYYTEKAEKYKDYVLENVDEKLDAYLDNITETFIAEAAPQIMIDEETVAKANALVEGFNSMLTTGGVYIKDIAEASESKGNEVEQLKAELDKLVTENAKLKKEQASKLRKSILDEAIKDLSVPSQEAVCKIEKHLKFVDESTYKKQLDSIISDAQMRGTANETSKTQVTESKTEIEESYSRFF